MFFVIKHPNPCWQTRKWLLLMLLTIANDSILQFVSQEGDWSMQNGVTINEPCFEIPQFVSMMWQKNLKSAIWQINFLSFGPIMNGSTWRNSSEHNPKNKKTNLTSYFRSKSTGLFLKKTSFCLMEQSAFYDTVLAHGDGTIENFPHMKHIPGFDYCKSRG